MFNLFKRTASAPKEPVKVCKDCAFYIKNESTVVWDQCAASPLHEQIHLIRGDDPSAIGFCTFIRADEKQCGASAKWFKPRGEVRRSEAP